MAVLIINLFNITTSIFVYIHNEIVCIVFLLAFYYTFLCEQATNAKQSMFLVSLINLLQGRLKNLILPHVREQRTSQNPT